MSAYIPALDDFGDSSLPLDKLMHRNRQSRGIRTLEPAESEPAPRIHPKAECAKHKHEFVVSGRRGLECLWCRRVAPDRVQEARA